MSFKDQGQATSDDHGHLVNATASEPPTEFEPKLI